MAELENRYTTEEVARRYHVTESTVQRWVRSGRLRAINLGGRRLGPYAYTPGALEEFERKAEIGKEA